MTWRIHVEPFTRPLFFVWSRLTRGKTLGAVSYTHLTLPTILLV